MKVRRSNGGAVLTLDGHERAALLNQFAHLIPQLTELEPGDPVWDRLHPEVIDDADGSADFRSMVDADLDRERSNRIATCLTALTAVPVKRSKSTVPLAPEQLQTWINAVNDVRLVRGTALGVTAENSGTWDPGAPDFAQWAWYHWLTGLQDALVTAAM